MKRRRKRTGNFFSKIEHLSRKKTAELGNKKSCFNIEILMSGPQELCNYTIEVIVYINCNTFLFYVTNQKLIVNFFYNFYV